MGSTSSWQGTRTTRPWHGPPLPSAQALERRCGSSTDAHPERSFLPAVLRISAGTRSSSPPQKPTTLASRRPPRSRRERSCVLHRTAGALSASPPSSLPFDSTQLRRARGGVQEPHFPSVALSREAAGLPMQRRGDRAVRPGQRERRRRRKRDDRVATARSPHYSRLMRKILRSRSPWRCGACLSTVSQARPTSDRRSKKTSSPASRRW